MHQNHFLKRIGAGTALAVVVLGGMLISSRRGQAFDKDKGKGNQGNDDDEQSLIQRGFAIAPVPLNLAGKNRDLVGLGSFLVNAVGDCNGCHSQGPTTQYTSNPYFRSPFFKPPKKVNTATYLGGGFSFGPLGPHSPDI